jgi:hypothetical protein
MRARLIIFSNQITSPNHHESTSHHLFKPNISQNHHESSPHHLFTSIISPETS